MIYVLRVNLGQMLKIYQSPDLSRRRSRKNTKNAENIPNFPKLGLLWTSPCRGYLQPNLLSIPPIQSINLIIIINNPPNYQFTQFNIICNFFFLQRSSVLWTAWWAWWAFEITSPILLICLLFKTWLLYYQVPDILPTAHLRKSISVSLYFRSGALQRSQAHVDASC